MKHSGSVWQSNDGPRRAASPTAYYPRSLTNGGGDAANDVASRFNSAATCPEFRPYNCPDRRRRCLVYLSHVPRSIRSTAPMSTKACHNDGRTPQSGQLCHHWSLTR